MSRKLSSEWPNQDIGKAKKAAAGPVFITDRGRPSHVLLTVEEYQRITGDEENIVDVLAMPDADDVDFDPPRLSGPLYRPVDF